MNTTTKQQIQEDIHKIKDEETEIPTNNTLYINHLNEKVRIEDLKEALH